MIEKVLVKAILEHCESYEWSLQGMGLLRMHFGDGSKYRLHIWDSRYRTPGVSMIHDHLQWNFESKIIAGHLTNQRYLEGPRLKGRGNYIKRTLKAGYGCEFVDDPKETFLSPLRAERYDEGSVYFQKGIEIHETDAEDGTVTFLKKEQLGNELARVFWKVGEEWGSAEPRPANSLEVSDITQNALKRWFKELT